MCNIYKIHTLIAFGLGLFCVLVSMAVCTLLPVSACYLLLTAVGWFALARLCAGESSSPMRARSHG